jgi:hypothetical protein
MERVAFLLEKSHQRLGCLLNPEDLVLRRVAGIHPRQSVTGRLTGTGLADDPLLYTGGGRTELELSLLFDVSLAGSSVVSADIRDLTAPLWRLSENSGELDELGQPPIVRFIWGKAWNIPGVIVAVAERLEHFTPAGVPQRSWLRLRMWRTPETDSRPTAAARPVPVTLAPQAFADLAGDVRIHTRLGGSGPGIAAAAPELSVGQALVSAGDLIAAAIDETPATAWLLDACRRIGDLVAAGLTDLADLAVSAGDSAAVRAVRDFLADIGARSRALVGEAKTRLVAAATAASAEIRATLAAVGRQVARVTGPVAAALSRVTDAIVANVRPLAQALAQSAALMAQAVRAKATQALASALPYLVAGQNAVVAALDRTGALLATHATQAVAAVRAVMVDVRAALAGLQRHGDPGLFAGVAAALGRIGPAIDALWAAGQRRTARLLTQTVPKLAQTVKNVLEAGAAMAAVAGQNSRRILVDALDAVRDLPGLFTPGEPLPRVALQSAVDSLDAAIVVAATTAPPAQWERVAQSHAALQAVLADVAATAPDAPAVEVPPAELSPAELSPAELSPAELSPALEALVTALAEVDAAEARATAHTVQQAVRTRVALEPDAVAEAAAERAPETATETATETLPVGEPARETTRALDLGERLDQLAFHYYGDAAYWRVLAAYNTIDHPLRLPSGLLLRVVPPRGLGGRR